MHKPDLIRAVSKRLEAENRRKPVIVQKHRFYISDQEGNKAQFVIKRKGKSYSFTQKDIEMILDAILDSVEDALRSGDSVNLIGFGSLVLHKRAARRTKKPGTEEWVEVEERLIPKFNFGNRLRMAARDAELILKDKANVVGLPEPVYEPGEV